MCKVKDLQRLAGFLNFLKSFIVDENFMKYVDWRRFCSRELNGVSLMMNLNWEKPDSVVSGEVFHIKFPIAVTDVTQDINCLECWTVLIALKVWGHKWSRLNVLAYCDNENTVRAINSGNSHSKIMQVLLRNIHWMCTKYSVMLRLVYRPGRENLESD